jgi:hypothetical protein
MPSDLLTHLESGATQQLPENESRVTAMQRALTHPFVQVTDLSQGVTHFSLSQGSETVAAQGDSVSPYYVGRYPLIRGTGTDLRHVGRAQDVMRCA